MMSIFTGAIDYFIKGGPCMWPLLLCSFVAIAIGVERYLYFKKQFPVLILLLPSAV